MPGIGIGLGLGMGVGKPQASLFNRVRQALFGSGEQGIYMPSVHESFLRGDLYQSSLGTAPVTAAGQNVGMWFDRSQGDHGPEITENPGGPFADATGWSASGAGSPQAPVVIDGELVVEALSAGNTLATGPISITAGALYLVIVQMRSDASLGVSFRLRDNSATSDKSNTNVSVTSGTTVGTYIGMLTATETLANGTFALRFAQAGVARISSVSVRAIPGNHASQSSASLRPAYQTAPERIDFDGVDDKLTATFASSLGSDCTVGLSIPGSGASILTGQTIDTSYDITDDLCGIVIVDRALTSAETAMLTELLNKAAGV